MKTELRLIFLAIISPFILVGQMLWPGDVNDNGIVNGIDVLYVGIAYGSTGAIRPGENEDWEAQPLGPLWSQSFFDGTNYAYADGDGSGEIDDDDIDQVIRDNFFLTHGTITPDEYSNGMPGSSPIVSVVPHNMDIGLGATAVFDLLLGTTEMPIQDFYGIAISLSYNTDLTFLDDWDYEEDENVWYDPSGDNTEVLFVDDEAGNMELAITRIDQQSITGSGKIGELSIVVEDIVFGLVKDTLHLEIEHVRMIDKNFNTLSAVSENSFVVISRPTATINPSAKNSVQVFPNPANSELTVTAADSKLLSFEIRKMTGEVVYASSPLAPDTEKIQIPLTTILKPQLYLLVIQTTKGVFVEKLILN